MKTRGGQLALSFLGAAHMMFIPSSLGKVRHAGTTGPPRVVAVRPLVGASHVARLAVPARLGAAPLGAMPIRATPLMATPLEATPLEVAPFRATALETVPREVALLEAAPTLRPQALRAALAAWDDLRGRSAIVRPRLTVIDYSLPSTAKRMWVFDMAPPRLIFHELVAHGRGSGENVTRFFSNEEGSLMTSLGAFLTGATYEGKNGYSLRLRGLERGLNDRAESRTIVIHGAPYVGEEVARSLGRLGRSHGCPALRPAIARTLIDAIKDRTLVYAWHPSLDAGRGGADEVSRAGDTNAATMAPLALGAEPASDSRGR